MARIQVEKEAPKSLVYDIAIDDYRDIAVTCWLQIVVWLQDSEIRKLIRPS